MTLEIAESERDGVLILAPRGRIDAFSAKVLEDALRKAVEGGHRHLVVNLQDTEYISSGGLRVFLVTLKGMRKDEGSLRLCCLAPGVHKIFKLAGFTTIFSIYPTEQDALVG